MHVGLSDWHGHQLEAHLGAIGALELGGGSVFDRSGREQRPAQSIGDPGGQQQPLGRVMALNVDVETGDVAEGIPPLRRVEHHGQGLAPAAQAQPVEIVHRLAALHAVTQQLKALMWIPQRGVDDQASWCAGEPLHQLRCFVDAAVPPDPGRHRFRQQGVENRKALMQGAMAAPQHHHIAAGGGTTAFFRQRAVGGHECFQGLGRIDGGRQGDQAPGHQCTQGRIDVLPTQVFGVGLPFQISHRLHHSPIQGRRAQREVGIQHRLTYRSNQGGGLLSRDGA